MIVETAGLSLWSGLCETRTRQQVLSRVSRPSSGLLDGRAVEAAVGDGPQDVLQVGDVSQDGVDVQVDAGQLASLGSLPLLHVPEMRPQMPIHVSLSAGQRVLQLLQTLFIHNTGLVWGEEWEGFISTQKEFSSLNETSNISSVWLNTRSNHLQSSGLRWRPQIPRRPSSTSAWCSNTWKVHSLMLASRALMSRSVCPTAALVCLALFKAAAAPTAACRGDIKHH